MKNNNITTTIRTLLAAAAILIAPAVSSISLRAQSFEPFSPYGVFSPAVESYQMTRCGNLLPSLYTGAMTFSLPLMTYSDPDFTIPVTLQYSYDGYKPGQHSGSVGYGWYLDCGGVITREVRGIPDEGDLDYGVHYDCHVHGWRHAGQYRDSMEVHSENIYSIQRKTMDEVPVGECVSLLEGYDPFTDTPMYAPSQVNKHNLYDTAPDIYHFRFLGHSGDFMMMPDGSVRVFNSDIPFGEVTVSFEDSDIFPWDVSITLTTLSDGYTYTFNCVDVSEIPDCNGDRPFRVSRSASAYHLTRITSPNRRSVSLSYIQQKTPVITPRYTTLLDGICSTTGLMEEEVYYGYFSSGVGAIPWTFIRESTHYPDSILVKDSTGVTTGSVVFNYSTPSSSEHESQYFDHAGESCYEWTGAPHFLSSVSLYGSCGLADSATLTYQAAANGGTPKYFLRTVTGRKTGTYTFSYDLDGRALPRNDTQDTDHWGYWNGSDIDDLRRHLVATSWMYEQPHFDTLIVSEPGADSTYFILVPDTTQRRRSAAHLYDQMVDSTKEAVSSFASAGALTRIRYPHGGATKVEYEPNRVTRRMNVMRNHTSRILEPVDSLDASATWDVGGVRVRMLVDSVGLDHSDTTRFSYADPDAGRRESGILMSMPKYAETVQYVHQAYASYQYNAMIGHSAVNATGLNNCCGITLTRDPHVVYPSVTVTHPDGSTTEHRFTSVTDPGRQDLFGVFGVMPKHIFGPSDYLENTGPVPSCMVPASLDCANLRGQPSLTVIRDAAGAELRRTEYSYSYDQAMIPRICFNNILTYDMASYTVRSPQLVSTVETERGVTVRTDRSYNALGQVSVTSVTQSPLAGGGSASPYGTVSVKMRYRHETGDTTRFRTLPVAAARTRTCGTAEYLLAREHYEYRQSKWQLSEIRSFTPDTPALIPSDGTAFTVDAGTQRKSTFTYGNYDRLEKVVFPGGNSLNYTWKGTHLTSKAVNDTVLNKTQYEWEDQIGLTKITLPSGCSETYLYDSANRPWKTLDTDTLTVSVINYRLKNQ
jgi:hypothetical protein